MESPRLGIDFGTTYSCVGVWKDGGIEIIPNGIGERTTPSVVIFDSPNKVYVGEETLNHISKQNSVKIYEIKRLIGKKYSELEDLLRYFSFEVVEDENQDKPLIRITFNNNESINYEPELIVSLIIKKLIANAQSYLNKIIKEIIITVPADFNNSQRNAIKYAAELNQGIKVISIINEPSAAVLSYGFPKKFLKNMFFPFNNNYTLLNNMFNISHPMEEDIYQIDGEKDEDNGNLLKMSLKTSFIDLNENKNIIVFDFGGGTYDVSLIGVTSTIFETKASAGNQHLGGGDFDNKLMEHCLKEFSKKYNISIEDVEQQYKCMERLKIACEQTKKILSIKDHDTIFIEDFYDNKPLDCPITKAFFEYLCDEYFKELIPPLDKVLSDAKLDNTKISEIILVGGSSKIPKVKELLKNKFPSSKINESISPDESVAYGATIYSESLIRNSGDFWANFGYLDTTQHSYGIELEDGTMEVLIPRGSNYPTNVEKFFFNAYNDQYTFVIKVFEGENKYVDDNDFLAEFTLKDFPKKKKGELCLSVTFTIDTNQILNVTGYVAEGNVRESIKIDKKPKIINDENTKLILGKITMEGDSLSKEEKKIKLEIINYCKNFKNMKTDRDKYNLIKNYNSAVNRYLSFLEEKCKDNKSEKYLFLVEKLFKSYSYLFKTQLNALVEINEKSNIQQKIEQYLEIICNNNPFRVKQLLIHFQDIKKDKSYIFYNLIIFCMQLLQKKGDDYFNNKEKISLQTAKNIYEECLLIGKVLDNDDLLYSLNDDEIIRNYNNIKDHCETQIKIISVDSLSEIENTRRTGKLFSNANHLDYDNLCLLSFNLIQSLNKLNEIEYLDENKEAFETKSICLALIAKIEILKNPDNPSKKLLDYCQESIMIAEKLGEECTNTEWYKEIKDIHQKLQQKSFCAPPPIKQTFEIEQEFKDNYNYGIDAFLKFLLSKYPIEGFEFSDQIIDKYNKNKRNFFVLLKQKYSKATSFKSSFIGVKDNEFQIKKQYIIQYINNCLNALK